MSRYFVVPFALVALAFSAQALAHHSFAATYVDDQSVTIEGQMVPFLLRNPHSFVHHRVRLLKFSRPKDGWSWGLLPTEKVD